MFHLWWVETEAKRRRSSPSGTHACAVVSVAGLERDKFDNKTVSFEEHINVEHNIWNYLYFIVLLREKNKTDYTGPESYAAHMMKVPHVRSEAGRLQGAHI